MKVLMTALVASLMLVGSANAKLYTWTDFSKSRIRYTLTGFESKAEAHSAAMASMQGLYDGILPKARMFQWEKDKCKDVNGRQSKKAISKYIQKRGEYAGVQTYGFNIGSGYNSSGAQMYWAKITARIPCLKKKRD